MTKPKRSTSTMAAFTAFLVVLVGTWVLDNMHASACIDKLWGWAGLPDITVVATNSVSPDMASLSGTHNGVELAFTEATCATCTSTVGNGSMGTAATAAAGALPRAVCASPTAGLSVYNAPPAATTSSSSPAACNLPATFASGAMSPSPPSENADSHALSVSSALSAAATAAIAETLTARAVTGVPASINATAACHAAPSLLNLTRLSPRSCTSTAGTALVLPSTNSAPKQAAVVPNDHVVQQQLRTGASGNSALSATAQAPQMYALEVQSVPESGTIYLLFSQPTGSHMLMLTQQDRSMLLAEPSVMPALPKTAQKQPGAAWLRPEELLIKAMPRMIISIHWVSKLAPGLWAQLGLAHYCPDAAYASQHCTPAIHSCAVHSGRPLAAADSAQIPGGSNVYFGNTYNGSQDHQHATFQQTAEQPGPSKALHSGVWMACVAAASCVLAFFRRNICFACCASIFCLGIALYLWHIRHANCSPQSSQPTHQRSQGGSGTRSASYDMHTTVCPSLIPDNHEGFVLSAFAAMASYVGGSYFLNETSLAYLATVAFAAAGCFAAVAILFAVAAACKRFPDMRDHQSEPATSSTEVTHAAGTISPASTPADQPSASSAGPTAPAQATSSQAFADAPAFSSGVQAGDGSSKPLATAQCAMSDPYAAEPAAATSADAVLSAVTADSCGHASEPNVSQSGPSAAAERTISDLCIAEPAAAASAHAVQSDVTADNHGRASEPNANQSGPSAAAERSNSGTVTAVPVPAATSSALTSSSAPQIAVIADSSASSSVYPFISTTHRRNSGYQNGGQPVLEGHIQAQPNGRFGQLGKLGRVLKKKAGTAARMAEGAAKQAGCAVKEAAARVGGAAGKLRPTLHTSFCICGSQFVPETSGGFEEGIERASAGTCQFVASPFYKFPSTN